MDAVRAMASCVLLVIVVGEGSKIKKSVLVGNSVSLTCPVSNSKPTKILWNDQVYSSAFGPIVIFQSENNPTFTIDGRHPNRANFEIDRSNYQLKISNLSFDSSGDYSCFSESDGRTNEVHYRLTVHDKQYCRGETQLREGQSTTLTCGLRYSGELPTIRWHHSEGAQATSSDHSDLTDEGPVGEKQLRVNATHGIDDKVFICQVDFGDRNETCRYHFNVTYAVRDVMLSVAGNTVYVGEEVRCTAGGNPRPDISLVAIVSAEEDYPAGRVDSRIVIPKSSEGRELTLECTANNTYRRNPRKVMKTATFQVLAATTPTTVKPTPKPTEPVKPVVDGDNNGKGTGRRPSASVAMLLFVATSLTLRTALLSRRC